jgi:hypothetical protein
MRFIRDRVQPRRFARRFNTMSNACWRKCVVEHQFRGYRAALS